MQLHYLIEQIRSFTRFPWASLEKEVEAYLSIGGTIHTQSEQEETLLSVAAQENQLNIVKMLVKKGGYAQIALSQLEQNLELIGKPLKSAFHFNNDEMVKTLLKVVPIEFYDSQVKTACLQYAHKLGNEDMITLVSRKENKAKEKIKPIDGISVFPDNFLAFQTFTQRSSNFLHHLKNAIDTKSPDFKSLLETYLKANKNAFSQSIEGGLTLLTYTVIKGKTHLCILEILLSYMDLEAIELKDGNYKSALQIAQGLEETEVISVLNEKIKTLKEKETVFKTPSFSCVNSIHNVTFTQLQEAVNNNDPNFDILLNNYINGGGNVYEQTLQGRTLLTLLVSYGSMRIDMIEALLPHLNSESLNIPDGLGEKPLTMAFTLGDKEVIDCLLKRQLGKEMIEPFAESISPSALFRSPFSFTM